MVSWPNELPGFGLDWKRNYKDNLYRSEPERGPAKVRLKNTAPVEVLSGTLLLTYSEFNTLLKFYEKDTKFGSVAFSYNDFIKGECRALITAFSYSNTGSAMDVDITLEIFK